MGVHNPTVAGLVADSTLRQLTRENNRLHHAARRYREWSAVAFGLGLGLVGIVIWAVVPMWRRGHETELLWAAVGTVVLGLGPWLIARGKLKRQIARFWAGLPDLAASGVMVIERSPGIGPSQLSLETELPSEEWPRWLHRKAGEVPSVSGYIHTLDKL